MKLSLAAYGKREIILLAGSFFLLFVVCLFVSAPVSVVWLVPALFVLYFFRDPKRDAHAAKDEVLAPADGKIVEIEKVFDKTHINAEVWKVGIFLSIFDVHLNRMPCRAVVKGIRYQKGEFRNALRAAASEKNERMVIDLFNPDYQVHLVVKQIAGVIARRIVCELKEGQEVAAGEKFGMIKFGSRTELYVPAERFEVAVRPGMRVKAGISVLGAFK
jgi:phosphatidylserine decarboxylase